MSDTMNLFEKAPVPQAVLKNALPAMAAMLMVLIYNLADTFFISQTHSDILVAAVGRQGLITGDMVKQGAVVVDVAMNRDDNGKLCGDVDFAAAAERAAYLTPVPGGVGPMTRAALMENTLLAAKRRQNLAFFAFFGFCAFASSDNAVFFTADRTDFCFKAHAFLCANFNKFFCFCNIFFNREVRTVKHNGGEARFDALITAFVSTVIEV